MHKRLLFFLFMLFFYEGDKNKCKVKEGIKYPHQAAPLALLMREMFLDMKENRISVEEGKTILENYMSLLSLSNNFCPCLLKKLIY